MIAGSLILVALILGAIGVPLARRFVYGYFHGADLFVVVNMNGVTQVYKNPQEYFGFPDEPLQVVPAEIYDTAKFEEYYNVCWFDCGTLYRCGHATHKTAEQAAQCQTNTMPESIIGKVIEER